MMIDYQTPEIFDQNDLLCIFTTANREVESEEREIAGLNLGINTIAEESDVQKNLKLLVDALEISGNRIAFAKQIHSNIVETVTRPDLYENVDGLVTKEPGLFLGIQVADCAAVLVADTEKKIAGAFHAGWRGAKGEIVQNGIEQMVQLGANPKNMAAFVSPCISQKMFEVGEEVAEQFPDEFVDYKSYSKPHIDLKGFIHSCLLQAGIPKTHIEIADGCTMSDEQYYSYRRERQRAGRMLGLIGFKK